MSSLSIKLKRTVSLWLMFILAGQICLADKILVNDVHTGSNPTYVHQVVKPRSIKEIQEIVRRARAERKSISIAGGRHSAGGQQFGAGTILIDTSALDQVVHFDPKNGIIEVQAGIKWPALINYLHSTQLGSSIQWAIIQKQTGADQFSLGGALSSNIHSRGLTLKPIISNVESFLLVNADGNLVRCSRKENPELFKLVIGGYGLFGVIATVQLRLEPRHKLERMVQLENVKNLRGTIKQRIADGYLYGDFQFSPDETSDGFMRDGILATYRTANEKTPMLEEPKDLSEQQWMQLLYLAHTDRKTAFKRYADFNLAANGGLYWSDDQQLSLYVPNYHEALDKQLGAKHKGYEMIMEVYVPRDTLEKYMEQVRAYFLKDKIELIYGTVRFIEKDNESFLAWAKQPYACVIFNVHMEHTPKGIKLSKEVFRRLVDLAIPLGGSFYLTYERYATREELEACYPQFREFLRFKKKYDPEERFQSDWYRYYRKLFS